MEESVRASTDSKGPVAHPLSFVKTRPRATGALHAALMDSFRDEYAHIRQLCERLSPIDRDQLIPENQLLFEVFREHANGPGFLEVLPTRACDHDCAWCFTRDSRSRQRIDESCLRSALDAFRDAGGVAVLFSGGGEPLLYRPLSAPSAHFDGLTLPQWAARKGLWPALITHGGLLRRFLAANADELRSIAFVRVSLDATTPARHATLHRADAAAFDEIVDSIRQLAQLRGLYPVPAIGVSFLVDPAAGVNATTSDLRKIHDLARACGADFIQLKHAHTHLAREADEAMVQLTQGLRRTAKPQWWIHRYMNVPATSACKIPLAAQVLRSDGQRSPCCHLQTVTLPGSGTHEVLGCTSPVCRYQPMNRVLLDIHGSLERRLQSLRALRRSLETAGFHPYRLYPSAPDLVELSE